MAMNKAHWESLYHTKPADRAGWFHERAERSLQFSRDTGLDIVRYRPETLHDEFGAAFKLIGSADEIHHTPSGANRKFIYRYCRR